MVDVIDSSRNLSVDVSEVPSKFPWWILILGAGVVAIMSAKK